MEEHQAINMTDSVSKFCVSFVTISVANKGMEAFIHSWNNHPIPSKWIHTSNCSIHTTVSLDVYSVDNFLIQTSNFNTLNAAGHYSGPAFTRL